MRYYLVVLLLCCRLEPLDTFDAQPQSLLALLRHGGETGLPVALVEEEGLFRRGDGFVALWMVGSDSSRIWIMFACWYSDVVGKGRLRKIEETLFWGVRMVMAEVYIDFGNPESVIAFEAQKTHGHFCDAYL